MIDDGRCTRAPAGWYCTRNAGHNGPCPTVPRWWNLRAWFRRPRT